MTEKAYMLSLNDDGELADILTWLDEHPDDDALRAEGIDESTRWRLNDWLMKVAKETESFPWFVPVPLGLARILEMVIENYAEVEASHGESFDAGLTCSEG